MEDVDRAVVDRAQLDPALDWLRVGELHPETLVPLSHDADTLLVAHVLAEVAPRSAGGAGPPPQQLRCVRQPAGAAVHLCLGREDARRGQRWMDWVLSRPDDAAAEAALAEFFEAALAVQSRGVMLGAAARADRQYVMEGGRPAFFFHIEHARHVVAESRRDEDVLSRDMLHFLAGAHCNPAFRDKVFALRPSLQDMTVVARVGGVSLLAPFGPLCRSMTGEEMAELAATGAVLELARATVAHGAQLPPSVLDLCAHVQRAAVGAVRPRGVALRLAGGRLDVAAERRSMAEGIEWIQRLAALYPVSFAPRVEREKARRAEEEEEEEDGQEGQEGQEDGRMEDEYERGGSAGRGGRHATATRRSGHEVLNGALLLRIPSRAPRRPRRAALTDFLEALAEGARFSPAGASSAW